VGTRCSRVTHPTRAIGRAAGATEQGSDGSEEAVQCRFCTRGALGDVIDAGGDVGRVHRACFVEWDLRQEGLEAADTIACFLPDPGEIRTELEMEEPLERAA
jgi:hypothetical protein